MIQLVPGLAKLVTVMDDYSRFILAWKLQKDMSAGSLIEAVQEAVDTTGMTEVPVDAPNCSRITCRLCL